MQITGAEEYRRLGREEGREEGQQEASRALLLALLQHKFGTLPDVAIRSIQMLNEAKLKEAFSRALDAGTLSDIGLTDL